MPSKTRRRPPLSTNKETDPITSFDPITGLPKTQNQQQALQSAGLTFNFDNLPTATGGPGGGTSTTPVSAAQQPGINTNSYLELLQSDPVYRQTLADLSAQGISDRSQADTMAIRALSQFGEVPTLDGIDTRLVGPDFARISAQARPLAEASTASGLSIVARMKKLRDQNVRAIRNALAARGALRSGETAFQLGEEQQRFTQANFDARSQLVDLLSGIETGYAHAQRMLQAQRAQAAQGAMGNVFQMFPTGPPQQQPAQPDPNTGMPPDRAAGGIPTDPGELARLRAGLYDDPSLGFRLSG